MGMVYIAFFFKYIKPEPQFVLNSWGSALYSITVCICAAKREQKLQKTEEFTTDHKPQEKLRTTARHAICGQIRKSSAEEVCACQGAVTKCKKSHICTDHKLTKAHTLHRMNLKTVFSSKNAPHPHYGFHRVVYPH